MSDLIRGARPVAAVIARRLERIGVPLTQAERERLEVAIAAKESYEPWTIDAAGRERIRDAVLRRSPN